MKLILFFLSLFLFSCAHELPDQDELIEKLYEKKKLAYLKEKYTKCKNEIMLEAEKEVDSLIIRFVQANLLDSIQFPKKPTKPTKPANIINDFTKFSLKEDSIIIE